jgi:hypothetical protein
MAKKKIPEIVWIIIALVLLGGTLFLKQQNIFGVMLWEPNEENIAAGINWTNEFEFVNNPIVGNTTSCLLYIQHNTNATAFEVRHGRQVYFENSTAKYFWCDDSNAKVIITPSLTDVDTFFSTFYKAREVECIETSDCPLSLDKNCDGTVDARKQCVNYECKGDAVVCNCITTNANACKRNETTPNDCSFFYAPKQIEVKGTCNAGTCSYPKTTEPLCSATQLFIQKNIWYVLGGVVLLIAGLFYFGKQQKWL